MFDLVTDLNDHQSTLKNTITAVLVCPGKDTVLLLQRNPHAHPQYHDPYGLIWELVGGQVEDGEESQAAALREIQEETGLHIPLLRLVGVCPFLSNQVAASNWIFFAEVEQEEPIRLSQEHLDSNWTPVEDALSMKLAFKHHDILTVCV